MTGNQVTLRIDPEKYPFHLTNDCLFFDGEGWSSNQIQSLLMYDPKTADLVPGAVSYTHLDVYKRQDLSNITEFALGADNASNLGATLYLDDIQLYKNSLTETWEEKENENENDNNNDNNNENDNDNDTGDNDNTDDNNNSDADDDNGGVTETGVEANLAILFLFAAAAVVVFRVKKACR